MKRFLSLVLAAAMALSLVACGKIDPDVLTEPPMLTVTNARGESIAALGGSYDWQYDCGNGKWSGAIACGAHPLDDVLRADMPVLEMPVAVSASFYYEVTLDFGENAPQSVSLRYWSAECQGDTTAESEPITAALNEEGIYTAALTPSVGIFAVDAVWESEAYRGNETYCFRTLAEGTQEQMINESRFDASAVKKLDISWLSGSVNIQAGAQTGEIIFSENADRALSDDEIMYCTLEGDTLSIRFLRKSGDNLDTEKYLTVYFPAKLLDAAQLEEITVETVSADVLIAADVSQKIDISTVSGDARVMTVSCPEVEIETTSGDIGVVDGVWQSVSVSTVSGGMEIAGDIRALDAESTSGDIALVLPECAVDLRFASTSGTLATALPQREGTMVACGDSFTEYLLPALSGTDTCKIDVTTVSGDLHLN